MNRTEHLDRLIRRFKLKGPDIARMTLRHINTVYGWTSKRKADANQTTIPESSLELLRFKLGDKKLLLHHATNRVQKDELVSSKKFPCGSKIVPFLQMPPPDQLKIIEDTYSLKVKDVAEMTNKPTDTAYSWLAAPDAPKFRRIPKCEIELILLKLGEIPLVLDRKVPPRLAELWERRGTTLLPRPHAAS